MLINFVAAERLLHSLKTAIACCIAYALAKAFGQQADQWIIVSTLVVMTAQIYVGGIMQKSYLRLLGTLMGCLVATISILLFKPTFTTTLATMAFASFFFSFIATSNENLNQMATLGVVTTAIIFFGNPPTMTFAAMRFVEISIGIIIAALVSQFIFPIHARTHLRRSQAASLKQMREYYQAAIINRNDKTQAADFIDLDESIIKSLFKQRQLAKDSAPELIGKRFDPSHFARSLYFEREMMRAINFMDIALSKVSSLQSVYADQNPLDTYNTAITQALDVLAKVLRANSLENAHIHLPNITLMTQAVARHPSPADPEQRIYLDGFVFCAEILLTNLRELALLHHIPVTDEPLPG